MKNILLHFHANSSVCEPKVHGQPEVQRSSLQQVTSLYFTDEEKSVLVFKYHYPHLINWAVFLAILPKFFAVHLPIYSKLTKKKKKKISVTY